VYHSHTVFSDSRFFSIDCALIAKWTGLSLLDVKRLLMPATKLS